MLAFSDVRTWICVCRRSSAPGPARIAPGDRSALAKDACSTRARLVVPRAHACRGSALLWGHDECARGPPTRTLMTGAAATLSSIAPYTVGGSTAVTTSALSSSASTADCAVGSTCGQQTFTRWGSATRTSAADRAARAREPSAGHSAPTWPRTVSRQLRPSRGPASLRA